MFRLGALNLGAPVAPATYDARRDVVVVLQDLGYVEGRNLAVERRYADGMVSQQDKMKVCNSKAWTRKVTSARRS